MLNIVILALVVAFISMVNNKLQRAEDFFCCSAPKRTYRVLLDQEQWVIIVSASGYGLADTARIR